MATYNQSLNTIRTLKGRETATDVDKYFYEMLQKCIEQDGKEGFLPIIGGNFNDDNKEESRMKTTLEGMSMVNITSPPDK